MKFILYHGNCYDGFGAAFAAWKKLGNEAVYIPVSYGQPVPDLTNAREVFIVDFSYDLKTLQKIADEFPVTVIDHHKTAQEALKDFAHAQGKVIFDMEKSGALLTWEYFFGDAEPAPLLIQHISDRDLWKFKLDGTSKIHKALVSYPMDFELWDSFDVELLKAEGETCERLYNQLVDNICQKAYINCIGGDWVPVVNTSFAWSEVGHELCKRFPSSPFVASYTVMKNSVMWSLRSVGEFDVSAVAKRFGGGGHKNAAGFKSHSVDITPQRSFLDGVR